MTGEAAWREPDPCFVWQEGGNLIVSGHKKSWRLSTKAGKACYSWDIPLEAATSKAGEPGDMCHQCRPWPRRKHGHFTGDTGAVLPWGSCKADPSGGPECTGVKLVPRGVALLWGRRWGTRVFFVTVESLVAFRPGFDFSFERSRVSLFFCLCHSLKEGGK